MAFGERISEIEIPVASGQQDIRSFLSENRDIIQNVIDDAADASGSSVKTYITARLHLIRETENGTQETEGAFRSNIYLNNDFNVDDAADYLLTQLENYNKEGSSWQIDAIIGVTITTAVYRPLAGTSFIELPQFIKDKYAVINPKNTEDHFCFLWAILAYLHPQTKDPQRISKYKPYFNELNITGLTFPLPIRDITKFMKLNPTISINVFGLDGDDDDDENAKFSEIIPIFISKTKRQHHVNMLLISNDNNSHFTFIKNMSRLVAHRTKHDGKSFVCDNCVRPYSTQKAYDNHLECCLLHQPTAVKLPTPKIQSEETADEDGMFDDDEKDSKEVKPILKFKSKQKCHPVPFVIYADFETFLTPIDNDISKNTSSTTVKNRHIASGFAAKTVCIDDSSYNSELVCYSDHNVIEKFIEHVLKERDRVKETIVYDIGINTLTPTEKDEYENTKNCTLCFEPFTTRNYKCCHHNHLSGQYISTVCNNCNLQLKPIRIHNEYLIPVIFHNLKRYDSHLIIEKLQSYLLPTDTNIEIIASNSEQFISFEFSGVRFIDSYLFLSASLETLVDNLCKSNGEFKFTMEYFKNDAMIRKGIYPYEFMTDPSKFEETKLPPKAAFYSQLSESHITDAEYTFAQKIYKEFGCKNLRDYHNLYLKSDVTLLADVFQSFRTLSLNIYQLDPAHYHTLPALSFDALLKYSKVELELLTDIEMYLYFEGGVRGGVASINHRYAEANNKYMGDKFDPSKDTSYILYLDMNNLYGYSMSDYLPVSDFEWLCESQFNDIVDNLAQIPETNEYGYVLEVDLSYPDHLHDVHSSLPLAPEKLSIRYSELSSYCQSFPEPYTSTPKLIPNLRDKCKYIVHYRNLQLYTKLGMKITKVHRILRFKQKPWMSSYIQLNTQLRQKSKSEFEKSFFKLANNSVYGSYFTVCCIFVSLSLSLSLSLSVS